MWRLVVKLANLTGARGDQDGLLLQGGARVQGKVPLPTAPAPAPTASPAPPTAPAPQETIATQDVKTGALPGDAVKLDGDLQHEIGHLFAMSMETNPKKLAKMAASKDDDARYAA